MGIRAQKPVLVNEDSLRISNLLLPGLFVSIPEVNYETTLKSWTKLLEEGTKSIVVTEGGEMTIFGALLKSVANTPVNVYSKLINQDSMLILGVSIELRKNVYVEKATGETELARAKSFLFNFGKDQYIDLVSEQVKAEEKKLRDLEKELGSLENDHSGMEKSIRSSNKTITTERDKLTVLNNELPSLSAQIIDETTRLNSMEEGDAKKEKAAYVKDLEKKKKKTLKAIAVSENKVSNAERKIDNANRNIPKNDRTQGKFRDQVSDQEAVLQKFENKLNTIKAYK
jgi:predicted  nucleic acid-binding Zn-ribbon protein